MRNIPDIRLHRIHNARPAACFSTSWEAGFDVNHKGQRGSWTNGAVQQIAPDEFGKLSDADAATIEGRVREVLAQSPLDPDARLLQGIALRKQGRFMEAAQVLKPLTHDHPHLAHAWGNLGMCLDELGNAPGAVSALLRSVDLVPFAPERWFRLGSLMHFPTPPADARTERIDSSCLDRATIDFSGRKYEAAIEALSGQLTACPGDICAMKLLADALIGADRWGDAKPVLAKCLKIAPDYVAARFRYATMLFARTEVQASLPQLAILVNQFPNDMLYLSLQAIALARSGKFKEAIAEYETFIEACLDRPGLWIEYAQVLRAAGLGARSGRAFARAAEILPSFVTAYWSAATMKSFHFSDCHLASIARQLERADITIHNRAELHFVLGKAFEDRREFVQCFENYSKSNELLRLGVDYRPERNSGHLQLTKRVFSQTFFRRTAGFGCATPDPIFIVGMPRAGSTLLEQILSSHSEVEALGELTQLSSVIEDTFGNQRAENGTEPRYPSAIIGFEADALKTMGESYLAKTRRLRRTGRSRFIDKLPGNFKHVGLIHAILPNARIVDARRHPLDCGWSCFKHYFPTGMPFAHRLNDIGRYYADYVELMAHFDEILPSRVHRVIYEHLVANPEGEIRGLFEYLDLPFEDQCMQFYQTERWVKTLSSDQVRRPLYKTGMNQWRDYEPWLAPLKDALGSVLEAYPDVPGFFAVERVTMTIPMGYSA